METNSQISERNCELCGKPAVRRCGDCRNVYYCGKQHQKEHWRMHKLSCKAFKFDEASNLVTTRSIKTGEILIKEDPVIWGPSFNSVPICLGCGKVIDEENSRPCFKCGWPVCNELCERSPGHIPECRYTSQRGERINVQKFGVPHPLYRCIMVLRCLYHKQFLPKIWKKLEKLETGKKFEIPVHRRNEFGTNSDFLRRFFKLTSVFSTESVIKMFEFVTICSYNVTINDNCCLGIYFSAGFLKHECTANCSKKFTPFGEILISAATEIKTGDPLSVCFINSLCGTAKRRQRIFEERFSWCGCSRCQDVTEFGTGFSAHKCQTLDCDGVVLPKNFDNHQKPKDWICLKCSQSLTSYSVYDVLERIERDLQDLDKSSIEECKNFINTYSCYLYKNHFYFFEMKYLLCQILGKLDPQTLRTEDLELKLHFCEDLESLIRKIAFAETKILAKVLYEKCATIIEINKRLNFEDKTQNLQATLKEVIQLLRDETDFNEKQIFEKATRLNYVLKSQT